MKMTASMGVPRNQADFLTLVKAIQEQQDLIESLTARVAELENN